MSKHLKSSIPQDLTHSPINEQKLKGLSRSLTSLPKSSFSRCIVFYCLIAMALIIVVSFYLTTQGYDVDTICSVSLAACSGELIILGAKRIMSKSEKVEDLILETIHNDLNDGKEYPIESQSTTITTTDSDGDTSTTVIKTEKPIKESEESEENNEAEVKEFFNIPQPLTQPIDDPSFYFNPQDASDLETEVDLTEEPNLTSTPSNSSTSEFPSTPKPEPQTAQPKKRGRPKKTSTSKQTNNENTSDSSVTQETSATQEPNIDTSMLSWLGEELD